MATIDELLKAGARRATELRLPYAGALMPAEAFELLDLDPAAKLVDVRTRAEWEWVGRPPGAELIEWNRWPGGARNPEFEHALLARVPDKTAPVLFLCRSGGRSHHAAAAAAQLGYALAFNILEGFEGDKDERGHRGTIGGWKVAGLPWVQS